jgi:chromosome segregation ATPase
MNMAKAAVAAPSVDLEAIDRLEQKLKQLVTVLERTRSEHARLTDDLARTRTEQARAAEENTRLRAELDAAKARAADAEGTGAELAALRSERAQIRGRVDDMLKQIDALNL